jgi:hypothetical protein
MTISRKNRSVLMKPLTTTAYPAVYAEPFSAVRISRQGRASNTVEATRPKLREIFAADFAVSLRLIAAFIAVVPVLILHT